MEGLPFTTKITTKTRPERPGWKTFARCVLPSEGSTPSHSTAHDLLCRFLCLLCPWSSTCPLPLCAYSSVFPPLPHCSRRLCYLPPLSALLVPFGVLPPTIILLCRLRPSSSRYVCLCIFDTAGYATYASGLHASSCLSPTWRLDPHLLLTPLSCPRSLVFPLLVVVNLPTTRGTEGLHQ